ncbi:SH3 domain-containing protein [Spirulina sp. 06S082]|uniref:SH3 domain-containing protein n=1 Tax=Spirulina sp. 06S082 TaxID=3110248 RepID=UPI002B1F887A|nr:SH3 domain-containing protein [Spirulina sp. 06S082]MEA5469955.1 SH3 domain-containing protein [Spirulina sp. 06S082]
MRHMKHWSRSFALLTVLLGIVGQGAAIARTLTNTIIPTSTQLPISISTQRNIQLAQFNNTREDFGRQGECRITNRTTALFVSRGPSEVKTSLGRQTEVRLLEDNNNGRREYIEVEVVSTRRRGYVNTANLSEIPFCSSPVSTGFGSVNRKFPPSQDAQFNTLPGCLQIENPNLALREGAMINSRPIEALSTGDIVSVIGAMTLPDRDGRIWVPVRTRFGYDGWIDIGIPSVNLYNVSSCVP